MNPPLFLTLDEMRELTGYAIKARQIGQLRNMGIPFRVNGCGRPVVTRLAVTGGGEIAAEAIPAWRPSVLMGSSQAGGA